MKIKLKLITYVFLCIASQLAVADLVVSQEEYEKYQNYSSPSKAETDKGNLDGPKIVVFQPDLDRAIKSPFPIEIFFQPNEGKKYLGIHSKFFMEIISSILQVDF